jgi:hypothetical protein
MSKQRIHVHLLHKKMNVHPDIKLRHRFYRGRVDKKGRICILVLSFVFCLVVSSEAGMVYGRVFAEDRPLKRGDTLTFFDEKKNPLGATTVDERGGYTISVPQGIYRVEFRRDDSVWEGWIQSTPQSVRQDIYLKKMMR